MSTRSETDGFASFFRQYTKTWMHAVATAGLTAFGTLTIVHRGFVVLALASYIVPPIVLYLSRTRGSDATTPETDEESRSPTEAALADRSVSDRSDDESDQVGPAAATSSDSRSSERRETQQMAGTDTAQRAPEIDDRRSQTDEHSPEPVERESKTDDGRSQVGTQASQIDESGSQTGTQEPKTGTQARESDELHEEIDERDVETDEPDEEPGGEPQWRTVDTPTDANFADVTIATGGGVTVGGGGVVLASTADEWELALDDGPSAQGQDLHAVDATADGDVVWVAGDGGTVGRLVVETGRHTDYSAPADRTDNLTGLAVAGATDDETILLTNGSGEVLRGRYRDGDLSWADPIKPGSGSSLAGVTLVDAALGYCCDTNAGVFETTDGGETFDAIGIDGADGTLTDVAAGEAGDDCHVSTDAGVVHRYDGTTWTPDRVTDGALSALARHDDRLVTIDDEGTIYDRSDPIADWKRIDTDASGALYGVAIGSDRSIAVGAEGTVIERR